MSDVTRPLVIREQHLSASELRKLPVKERNAILALQAALAEPIYRTDARLTDFEAFGEDDLHGESSSNETG
jgi:hypothetical protein